MFKEYRVSGLQAIKVLETAGDNSCTAMSMLLLLLNNTLKMVKMVNFMLCVFYHNLRKREDGRKREWGGEEERGGREEGK